MMAQTTRSARSAGLLRRTALAAVVAGIAGLGVVGTAPVALAASGVGPDAFVEMDHGRKPVFFCDPGKIEQRHENCLHVGGPRF